MQGAGFLVLAEGARLVACSGVVVGERAGQFLRTHSKFSCHSCAGIEALHNAASHIVLAVPLDFFGRLPVKDETKRPLASVHLTRDIVAAAKFVAEPAMLRVLGRRI